jgi:hypothetical protein
LYGLETNLYSSTATLTVSVAKLSSSDSFDSENGRDSGAEAEEGDGASFAVVPDSGKSGGSSHSEMIE